jgi:hypothetical protein
LFLTKRSISNSVITATLVILFIVPLGACDHFKKEIKVDPEAKPIYRDPMVQPQTNTASSDPVAAKPPPARANYPKVKTPTPKPDLVHKVRWPGETLTIIALWYTGNTDHWPKLSAANPSIDPRRIYIGHRIRIPAGLLKTRQPLSRDFVNRHAKGHAPEPANPVALPQGTSVPSAANTPTTPSDAAAPESATVIETQMPPEEVANSDNDAVAPPIPASEAPQETKSLPALFGPRDISGN